MFITNMPKFILMTPVECELNAHEALFGPTGMNKIPMIKVVRDVFDCGLKESKEFVDNMVAQADKMFSLTELKEINDKLKSFKRDDILTVLHHVRKVNTDRMLRLGYHPDEIK